MTRDEGDGNHEIFRVSSSIVRRLSNTDLNVRIKEIFMIPRDGIRRIFWSWGARELAGAGGDHYDVRRGDDGKWAYADSAHVARKKAVDGERVDDLLDRVNFIEAKAFLGRGEAYVEKTEMTPDAVHGRLIVEYEEEGKVKQAEILLSDDVRRNRSRGEPAYCARFADSDILFFIDPALIGDLRLDVDERPEMDRGGHRH